MNFLKAARKWSGSGRGANPRRARAHNLPLPPSLPPRIAEAPRPRRGQVEIASSSAWPSSLRTKRRTMHPRATSESASEIVPMAFWTTVNQHNRGHMAHTEAGKDELGCARRDQP